MAEEEAVPLILPQRKQTNNNIWSKKEKENQKDFTLQKSVKKLQY